MPAVTSKGASLAQLVSESKRLLSDNYALMNELESTLMIQQKLLSDFKDTKTKLCGQIAMSRAIHWLPE